MCPSLKKSQNQFQLFSYFLPVSVNQSTWMPVRCLARSFRYSCPPPSGAVAPFAVTNDDAFGCRHGLRATTIAKQIDPAQAFKIRRLGSLTGPNRFLSPSNQTCPKCQWRCTHAFVHLSIKGSIRPTKNLSPELLIVTPPLRLFLCGRSVSPHGFEPLSARNNVQRLTLPECRYVRIRACTYTLPSWVSPMPSTVHIRTKCCRDLQQPRTCCAHSRFPRMHNNSTVQRRHIGEKLPCHVTVTKWGRPAHVGESRCKPIKLTIETMEPNPHNVVGEKPSD